MKELRKLPVGIQRFEDIIESQSLYVDKTRFIYELVSQGKPYFLARPCSFGKSLFLSTLECYFLGKKELFTGLELEHLETKLAILENRSSWEEYPVFHIDLSNKKYYDFESLNGHLSAYLNAWEAKYFCPSSVYSSLDDRFAAVIKSAYEITGKKVVVLIDEYDKPLIESQEDSSLLEDYVVTLKAFYSVLKACDHYLRFIFLTGTSKFDQIGLFSNLNQIQDISLTEKYATLCGFTQNELVTNFTPELLSFAEKNRVSYEEGVDKIKHHFEGYNFCENSNPLFNPFSILNTLALLKIQNYWFDTGAASFLLSELKRTGYDIRNFVEGVKAKPDLFLQYQATSSNIIPLFYQNGFITIKNYSLEFGSYFLTFPNTEVKYGFLNFVLPFYTSISKEQQSYIIEKFVCDIRESRIQLFMEQLIRCVNSIAFDSKQPIEKLVQIALYVIFSLIGQFIKIKTYRKDDVCFFGIWTEKNMYLFNLVVDKTTDEAFNQLEKTVGSVFKPDGRKTILVATEYNSITRNVSRWLLK